MYELCHALRAQTIFYFRRTCFFGNAARTRGVGGGVVRAAFALRAQRRIVLAKEVAPMSEGFRYVCIMPCPSSGVERSEELMMYKRVAGDVDPYGEGFRCV